MHSGYGIGFDLHWLILFPDVSMGKNITIFGVDMSSFVYITLAEEAQYSINFSRSNRKCCLSIPYHGGNGFLFVNPTKIY